MSIFVSAAQLLLWRRDLLDHNTSNRTPARFSLTWISSYTVTPSIASGPLPSAPLTETYQRLQQCRQQQILKSRFAFSFGLAVQAFFLLLTKGRSATQRKDVSNDSVPFYIFVSRLLILKLFCTILSTS